MNSAAPKRLKLTGVLAGALVLLSVLASAYGKTYYEQARRAHDQRKFDEAIHLYTQAIENDKLDRARLRLVYCCRGMAWCAKGDYDLGITDYNRAIELDPKFAYAYQCRGVAWHDKGAFGKAIADYTRAIKLDPKYAYALRYRAMAWYATGAFAKAVADYTRLIKLDPKFARTYRSRGMVRRAMGRYDKALADFSQAIELDPKFPCNYADRGSIWCAKGDFDKALADYNGLLKLDPRHENVHRLRGQMYFSCGKFADAAKDFHRALALQPDDERAAMWLYLAQRRTKNPADKKLNAFASKYIKDRSVWRGALFDFLSGRIDAAKCLKAAEPQKPDLSDPKLSDDDKTARKAAHKKLRGEQLCEAYFFIAQYELLRGRKNQARKSFKKCLATNVRDCFPYISAKAELKRMGGED
ncbi:MAG: tetratricopeptide repeat protein [Phycisphaerae bacterium]|jgi:lipoprotein NlpI|nr:tetratricopeptide repeat protein [Phycisphaerae bacterium]